MKAIVQDRFGPPETLQLSDIEVPQIGDGEVLVQIHAAALNPYDWHMLRGDPRIARRKPPRGADPARVPDRGPARRRARGRRGRRCARPQAGRSGLRVLPGLARRVRAGQGGHGGTQAGVADVRAGGEPAAGRPDRAAEPAGRSETPGRATHRATPSVRPAGSAPSPSSSPRGSAPRSPAACTTRNHELVRSLGAAHVVDYTQEDFTDAGERYDVIFENAGGYPCLYRRALTPTGIYIANNGGTPGTLSSGRSGRW